MSDIKCGNCKQFISKSSFLTHEVHCIRFLEKCQICSDLYPKIKRQQHLEEVHYNEKCQICLKDYDVFYKESHQKSCINQLCIYCSQTFSQEDIQAHQYICGGKSESCLQCGQMIVLKQVLQHKCSWENNSLKRKNNQNEKETPRNNQPIKKMKKSSQESEENKWSPYRKNEWEDYENN